MTENELLERCRRGERLAQHQLYIQTSSKIYGLLLRMTRNADDAFDLAQNTFVRVFENIASFDGGSRLTTWMYRIAVNEALQFLRRQKRREMRHANLAAQQEIACARLPERAQADIQEALALLPAEERAIILLRYFEGLNYSEMSQVLGKPMGTIASRLNRAREHLRQLLLSERSAEA